MADVKPIKSGTFGRPKVPPQLPDEVWEHVDSLMYSEENDWTMFSVDGQLWTVLKCWEDDTNFTIVAAKVEHETMSISVDSVRGRSQKAKSYYDFFERS